MDRARAAVPGGGGAATGSAIRPDDFKGARFSVGSKEFTEQLVLGQIAVEALKAGGALVKDRRSSVSGPRGS
jgi:osmoprotectant transport system substrate-binding protein